MTVVVNDYRGDGRCSDDGRGRWPLDSYGGWPSLRMTGVLNGYHGGWPVVIGVDNDRHSERGGG